MDDVLAKLAAEVAPYVKLGNYPGCGMHMRPKKPTKPKPPKKTTAPSPVIRRNKTAAAGMGAAIGGLGGAGLAALASLLTKHRAERLSVMGTDTKAFPEFLTHTALGGLGGAGLGGGVGALMDEKKKSDALMAEEDAEYDRMHPHQGLLMRKVGEPATTLAWGGGQATSDDPEQRKADHIANEPHPNQLEQQARQNLLKKVLKSAEEFRKENTIGEAIKDPAGTAGSRMGELWQRSGIPGAAKSFGNDLAAGTQVIKNTVAPKAPVPPPQPTPLTTPNVGLQRTWNAAMAEGSRSSKPNMGHLAPSAIPGLAPRQQALMAGQVKAAPPGQPIRPPTPSPAVQQAMVGAQTGGVRPAPVQNAPVPPPRPVGQPMQRIKGSAVKAADTDFQAWRASKVNAGQVPGAGIAADRIPLNPPARPPVPRGAPPNWRPLQGNRTGGLVAPTIPAQTPPQPPAQMARVKPAALEVKPLKEVMQEAANRRKAKKPAIPASVDANGPTLGPKSAASPQGGLRSSVMGKATPNAMKSSKAAPAQAVRFGEAPTKSAGLYVSHMHAVAPDAKKQRAIDQEAQKVQKFRQGVTDSFTPGSLVAGGSTNFVDDVLANLHEKHPGINAWAGGHGEISMRGPRRFLGLVPGKKLPLPEGYLLSAFAHPQYAEEGPAEPTPEEEAKIRHNIYPNLMSDPTPAYHTLLEGMRDVYPGFASQAPKKGKEKHGSHGSGEFGIYNRWNGPDTEHRPMGRSGFNWSRNSLGQSGIAGRNAGSGVSKGDVGEKTGAKNTPETAKFLSILFGPGREPVKVANVLPGAQLPGPQWPRPAAPAPMPPAQGPGRPLQPPPPAQGPMTLRGADNLQPAPGTNGGKLPSEPAGSTGDVSAPG